MKIIVLSKTDYKEKDVIINAISESEEVSFLVKGFLNPTNPFKWLNNPLTLVDVEFVDNKDYKYPVLKRADLISSPFLIDQSYEKLMAVNLASEATIKMLLEEERYQVYNDIINFLENLRKPNADIYTLVLIYLAKMIKLAGAELEVNSCVSCGSKKNIVAFSFDDGGFICSKCANESTKCDLSSTQMRIVRFIFSAPDFSYPLNVSATDQDKVYLLNKFYEFIAEKIGVELDSISLLLK